MLDFQKFAALDEVGPARASALGRPDTFQTAIATAFFWSTIRIAMRNSATSMQVKAALAAGQPAISVDTKKKELVVSSWPGLPSRQRAAPSRDAAPIRSDR